MKTSVLKTYLILISMVCGFCNLHGKTYQSPLRTQERIEEGRFYTSHPVQARMIKSNSRMMSTRPEALLKVTMESIQPDGIGRRSRNLFFTKEHLSRYVEAIDQFIRMSESQANNTEKQIAVIPSWESFHTKRDLSFTYLPKKSENGIELLRIQLGYDTHFRGGSFYFGPIEAQQLLNLLFEFMKDS